MFTRTRPVVYGLFLLSGCTGLIYEVVWTRQLILLLGGTTYAITTVLVAFMAGLGLGSFLAGRWTHRLRKPNRVYGLLEIGVGLYALLVPVLLGLAEPARARFIRAAYHLLDLISYFTVGEDEVRAWTIRRGDKAPRAAGRIHSDLERGFIRAEVVHFDDFVALGSEAKARTEGKLRLEGKEYVVKDGDIMNIRHSS